MSKYTLKSIVQRGSMLGAAFAIAASAVVPAASTFADALNPLTDRSLTLSSSAPGWDYLDGSGNTTYSPPNSGANGKQVGNTFDFKVSTDTVTGDNVEAISFQYCTTPAGNCTAPGNNDYTDLGGGNWERNANGPTETALQHSDLDIIVDAGQSEATLASRLSVTTVAGNPDGVVDSIPARTATGENFMVYYSNGTNWVQSTGWEMSSVNNEDGDETDGAAGVPKATGTNNEIQLTHGAGGQGFASGTRVKVVFFATDDSYITNPGSGAFFVRMNTYSDPTSFAEADVIDGGVTVANVMNLGIQITTKVLETMDFSVGTVDPYTLEAIADDNGATPGGADTTSQLYAANSHSLHSVCDPILTKMDADDADEPANRLQLGDPDAEFSLRTDTTYSTHSYWRLSSNSSAGATVYYSGNTLTNTVEDEITPIGANAAAPLPGGEQFGLALANGTIADNNPALLDFPAGISVHSLNYNVERESGKVYENAADNEASGLNPGTGTPNTNSNVDPSVTDNLVSNLDANPSWHTPRLYPLVPDAEYDGGAGNVNTEYGSIGSAFAFDPTSLTIPVEIASQDTQVVNCVTGKMRYIANIAATTPAGIYTTKINYIAAPQY